MTPAAATCLLIALSHGGHCLGGGPCTVELAWAANAKVTPAVVTWGLTFADTAVSDGRVLLQGGASARIVLELPTVRARTEMTWSYRLLRQSDGQLLEEGRRVIQVYPAVTSPEFGTRLGTARVLVLEAEPGLSRFLEHAGVKHQVVSSSIDVELRGADFVLVGPGRLTPTASGADALLSAAERGAALLVLVQPDAAKIFGLEVVRHSAEGARQWQQDHPLLAGLPANVWQGWLAQGPDMVTAIALPPTEPVLEVAYWPPPAESRTLGPLDAALFEKRVGRGRLIACQVPASADFDDPRTQMFLVNALDYMRTTPRPTPPRAERLAASKPARLQPRPDNTVGVGDD